MALPGVGSQFHAHWCQSDVESCMRCPPSGALKAVAPAAFLIRRGYPTARVEGDRRGPLARRSCRCAVAASREGAGASSTRFATIVTIRRPATTARARRRRRHHRRMPPSPMSAEQLDEDRVGGLPARPHVAVDGAQRRHAERDEEAGHHPLGRNPFRWAARKRIGSLVMPRARPRSRR